MKRAVVKPVVWQAKEPVLASDPEYGDPLEILDEMRRELRESMTALDDLARMLAEPPPKVESEPIPLPQREGQLSLDDLGGAA